MAMGILAIIAYVGAAVTGVAVFIDLVVDDVEITSTNLQQMEAQRRELYERRVAAGLPTEVA